MTTSADPIPTALAHHQAGRLDEAARIYEQVLAANPRHAGAMHLLGLVALQSGQFDTAVDRIQRAIEIDAAPAAFHANLAEAYRNLGRLGDAEACYRAALQRNSQLVEAHCGLGMLLEQRSQTAEAARHYEAAATARPDYFPAHLRRGVVLQLLGRLDEAAAALVRRVCTQPVQSGSTLYAGRRVARPTAICRGRGPVPRGAGRRSPVYRSDQRAGRTGTSSTSACGGDRPLCRGPALEARLLRGALQLGHGACRARAAGRSRRQVSRRDLPPPGLGRRLLSAGHVATAPGAPGRSRGRLRANPPLAAAQRRRSL